MHLSLQKTHLCQKNASKIIKLDMSNLMKIESFSEEERSRSQTLVQRFELCSNWTKSNPKLLFKQFYNYMFLT